MAGAARPAVASEATAAARSALQHSAHRRQADHAADRMNGLLARARARLARNVPHSVSYTAADLGVGVPAAAAARPASPRDGFLDSKELGSSRGAAGERSGEGGEQGGHHRPPRGEGKSGAERRCQRRLAVSASPALEPVSAASAAAHAFSLLHSAQRQAGSQAGVPSEAYAPARATCARRAARADGRGLGLLAQRAHGWGCKAAEPGCQGCEACVSADSPFPSSRLRPAFFPSAAVSACSASCAA